MEEIDGLCKVDDNDFRDQSKFNYIEIKQTIFDGGYIQLGQKQASYNSTTGEGFFSVPQGSIVDIRLDIIGITLQSNVTVPALSTVTLNTLLS